MIAETTILILQIIYLKNEIDFIQKLKLAPKCIISSIIMFLVVLIINKYTPSTLMYCILESIIGVIVYILLLIIMKYEFLNNIINQIKQRSIKNEK